MRIDRLDLIAYGGFTDRSLDLSAGPNRFHVVVGPNEAGKSTTMRAIEAWLFGFGQRTDDDYLHPMKKLRVGGLITDDAGRSVEVVRRKGNKQTLSDADGEPVADDSIDVMLGGVDADQYRSRYGLSHQDLIDGGQEIIRGGGDLGPVLFAAGAGLGRLRDIRGEIESAADALFRPRASKAVVPILVGEVNELREELKATQLAPSRYMTLRDEVARQRAVVDELSTAAAEAGRRADTARRWTEALPLVPIYLAVDEEWRALDGAPNLGDDFTARRRDVQERINLAEAKLRDLRGRVKANTRQLEEMPEDPGVTHHASEIQELNKQLSSVLSSRRDSERLQTPRRRSLETLVATLADLDVAIDDGPLEQQIEHCRVAVARLQIGEAARAEITELVQTRAALIQNRDTVAADARTVADEHAELRRKWDEAEDPGSPDDLEAAVTRIGDVDAVVRDARTLSDEVDQATAECESWRRKLDGFDGDVDAAVALALPDMSRLKEIARSIDETTARRRRIDERIAEVEADRDRCDAECNGLRRKLASGDEGAMHELRNRRDGAFDSLEPTSTVKEFGDVRTLIRQADDASDDLRRNAQTVERIRQLEIELTQAADRLTELRRERASAAGQADAAAARWRALWSDIGVRGGDPESMRQWYADHRSLLAADAARGRVVRRRDEHVTRIEGYAATLQPWIDTPEVADVGERLIAATSAARNRLAAWRREHADYEQLRSGLASTETSIKELRRQSSDAEAAIDRWEKRWTELTAVIGGGDTGRALKRLTEVKALAEKEREVSVLFMRIDKMGQEIDDFAARVDRIADAVGVDPNDDPTLRAAELMTRLQAEDARRPDRQRLIGVARDLERDVRDAETEIAAATKTLDQLMAEAGVDAVERLPEAERRSAERREAERRRREVVGQLTIHAAGTPLEAFIEEVRTRDAEGLAIERREADQAARDAREAADAAQQELGRLAGELAAMDGGHQAAEVSQRLELASAELSAQVRRYVRARVASLLLDRAMEHYRRGNQSPVLKLADEAFATLTRGRYAGLRPEMADGGKTVLSVNPAGGGDPIPAGQLSTGTADALYLALRLASLRHSLAGGRRMPLIVDDCLIQFDDDRAAAALELMSDLSRETQVVMFTHHEHLATLAERTLPKDGWHLHRL